MASATDNFMEVAVAASETTLAAPGHTIGGTTINITSASGWPTATGVIFAMRRVDSDGNYVSGTYTEWAAALSGTALSSMTLLYGSDQNYANDGLTQVYIPASASLWNRLITTILQQHTQTGTHTGLTTDTITTSALATLASMVVQSWDGWVSDTHTWVYVSSTSFKITGVNLTALFPVGTKIKLTQSSSVAYFYVIGSSYSTDTTVTVAAGSDYSLSNTTISSPAYSYVSTPQGFPTWFNFTPSFTNLTVGNGTLVARFTMQGKLVTTRIKLTWGSTTSASGIMEFSPAVNLNSDYAGQEYLMGLATAMNVGVSVWAGVVKALSTSLLTFTAMQPNSSAPTYVLANSGNDWTATIPFSWTNGSILFAQYSYESA
jgi:hypothetical protein